MSITLFDFNAIAESYDNWYDNPVTARIDELEKKAIDALLPSAATHPEVLEVGSGTGRWTQWLADKGFSVTGIDPADKMVEIARKKKIENARFIEGDFIETVFDRQFDITIAITSLEFIPDNKKAVQKMSELTRPGGTVIAGVLNAYSYMGLAGKIKGSGDPVFGSAHFFTWSELKKLLSAEGQTKMTGSTFMLPYKWAIPFSSACEVVGKNLFPVFGNFLAGRSSKS